MGIPDEVLGHFAGLVRTPDLTIGQVKDAAEYLWGAALEQAAKKADEMATWYSANNWDSIKDTCAHVAKEIRDLKGKA